MVSPLRASFAPAVLLMLAALLAPSRVRAGDQCFTDTRTFTYFPVPSLRVGPSALVDGMLAQSGAPLRMVRDALEQMTTDPLLHSLLD